MTEGAACNCGAIPVWDPAVEGTTCGGLDVVGGLVCACGQMNVCRRSKPRESWKLNKGGRSVDACGVRLRAEAGPGVDVAALMARIARVPDLERRVAELEAELAKVSR